MTSRLEWGSAAALLVTRAIHDGIVASADTFVDLGHPVIGDHGGQTFTLYRNLRDESVARGEGIEHGQIVGSARVAATGAAGLFFELRVDGWPVDPLQWVKKR